MDERKSLASGFVAQGLGVSDRIGEQAMTEYMKGGKVRRWLDSQVYRFIKRDGGGPDLFLHRQQVIASGLDPYDINENARVYFDIGRDKTGHDVAINIKLP
jgi:cold shock CspA family protein